MCVPLIIFADAPGAAASLGKRKSGEDPQGAAAAARAKKNKKQPLTNERREERNLREKERSLKITEQIHELRNLLSSGGVIVPKVSFGGVHHDMCFIAV